MCAERDGDRNVEYLRDQNLRRDFRAIFEPHLPNAISGFENCCATATDKHVVSMFMAALMICTPAWRRVGAEILDRQLKGQLIHETRMRARHGHIDDRMAEAVGSLERNELAIEHDPAYVEARATVNAMPTAVSLFRENWTVSINRTTVPSLTSDSPFSIDWVQTTPRPIMFRHLPLSPLVSVTVAHSGRFKIEREPDVIARILAAPQEGGIRYISASLESLERINIAVVQGAEDLVFSSRHSALLAEQVARFASHRLVAEYVEIEDEAENSLVQGAVLKVKAR